MDRRAVSHSLRRRCLVLVGVLGLLAGGVPALLSSPPASGSSYSAAAAGTRSSATMADQVAKTASSASAATAGGGNRPQATSRNPVEEAHFAEIDLKLSPDGRTLTAAVKADARIADGLVRFTTIVHGKATSALPVTLGTLKTGQSADKSVTISPPSAREVLGVSLSSAEWGTQAQYVFAEPRDGGYVTAISSDGLAGTAIARDLARGRISRAQYSNAYHRLHSFKGFTRATLKSARTPRAERNASSQAATGATVTGTITYQDKNGDPYPVRNAWIGITSNQSTATVVNGRTNSDGTYSLTFQPADCSLGVAYEIVLQTDDGVGKVVDGNGKEYAGFSQSYFTPCAGQALSGVNVAITKSSDTGKAFALLDAVDTVGTYYSSIRQSGWTGDLVVHYPYQSEYTTADQIYVPGSSASCGSTSCPEEAFDWDALAHESGHVVQYEGGFKSGVPSPAHYICANAWGNPDGSSPTLGKSDALGLAWNEGWATFYGLTALQAEGWPSGMPDIKNRIYTDNAPGSSFDYGIDDNGASDTSGDAVTCTPSGDDSELAVQRALWEFTDTYADRFSGDTGWAMPYILSTFESAKPQTFQAAYQTLISGQPSSVIEATRVTLTALGFAPSLSNTAESSCGSVPTLSWSPGGDSGYTSDGSADGKSHPNNDFVIRWTDSATGSTIEQDETQSHTYTPSASEWQLLSSHPSVQVTVLGEELTSPVTGPYGTLSRLVDTQCGVAPPAQTLSNYEFSSGHSLTRDCGFSTTVTGPGSTNPQDLWLFCDSIDYAPDGTISSAILGTDSAAEAPLVAGQVPQNLTEVTTPPAALTLPSSRGPAPFLPVPTGLRLPGSNSSCTGSSSNGVYGAQSPGIYPASWFTGVTAESSGQVIMAVNNYCVDSETGDINTLFTDEGFGLFSYNPATNKLGSPVYPFATSNGTNLPLAEQLTSPIVSGSYLYLFVADCTVKAYGTCGSGNVYMARVPVSGLGNSSQYQFWTGSTWSSSYADAGNLIPGATALSVSIGDYTSTGHGFVMVDETDLAGDFQVWTASTLTGPWKLLQTGTVPSSCSGGEFGCYAINGHPELSTAGDLMISYYDPAGNGHLHLAAVPWGTTAASAARPSARVGQAQILPAAGQAAPRSGLHAP
jgi:hypothetical protein